MRTFAVFFLFLAVGTIYAQNNFQRGFIITNEQDTISGWINFGMDVENMAVCHFKANENDEVITFLPGEIFGYRFYDIEAFYVSREIVINDVPRTVFLQFLVQGMMNLYYFVDTDGTMFYFFEDQTGRMIPVTREPSEEVRIEGHGLSQFRQDFRYRGVVRYLFNEQEAMSRNVSRVRFDQRSMINLAVQYHDLTCPIGEDCIVFVGSRIADFTQVKFSVYGGALFYAERFINTITPTVGGRITISNPRIVRNLSFQADLSISRINANATYNLENTPWRATSDRLGFRTPDFSFRAPSTYLAYWETRNIFVPVSLGFKYSFGNNRIRPVAEGGIVFATAFNRYVSFKYGSRTSNWISTLQHRDVSLFHLDIGAFAGLGLEYALNNNNFVFINVRANIATWVNFLQLKIGYTF